jgi:hypothetical protein
MSSKGHYNVLSTLVDYNGLHIPGKSYVDYNVLLYYFLQIVTTGYAITRVNPVVNNPFGLLWITACFLFIEWTDYNGLRFLEYGYNVLFHP